MAVVSSRGYLVIMELWKLLLLLFSLSQLSMGRCRIKGNPKMTISFILFCLFI
uniref:Uncharacterized protein n=1 Tax=Octopus bimaculoides TaxID=37653 RepID=A0A0L8GPU8_OCTBM